MPRGFLHHYDVTITPDKCPRKINREIIETMVRAVPARRARLDQVEVARLRGLTGELIAAKPEAAAEYARFLGVKRRGLCLPEAELTERLGGASVLVTGGRGASARC